MTGSAPPAPPGSNTTWSSELRLNHIRRGSGSPLLLLHALGGELGIWAPVVELLAAEHEVVAVDMPGFGRSPQLAGAEPSPANLARALASFWDGLGIEADPAAAGISLGGWVAIEMARLGRARAATAIAPAGFWPQPLPDRRSRGRPVARAVSPLVPLMMRSNRLRGAALAAQVAHPERVPADQAARIIRSWAHAPGYPEANRLMRGSVVGDLSGLETPLTIAWAEHDRLVRNRPLQGLPESIRQVVLRGCGHLPTWDAPELVARTITETAPVASR